MAKSVATIGDVLATPGTTPFTGAEAGVWTPGPVSHTSYAQLRSSGVPAISEATCIFSFAGTAKGGAAVAGSETVVLRAGPTVLQRGSSGVIVHGDSATGEFGNRLAAASAEPLRTD